MLSLMLRFTWLKLMFCWNPDGHCLSSKNALADAIQDLDMRGILKRLGVHKFFMQSAMAWLPMDNCTQDVVHDGDLAWENFSSHIPFDPFGKTAEGIMDTFGSTRSPIVNHMAYSCAIALTGDQLRHFMKNLGESAGYAHYRSMDHVKKSALQSWHHFNEAFPRPGWGSSVEGFFMEIGETHIGDVAGGAVLDEWVIGGGGVAPVIGKAGVGVAQLFNQDPKTASKFHQGQNYLGAALHTLQDSFSPAHTFRNPSNRHLIEDVYLYNDANQKANAAAQATTGFRSGEAGWPGHDDYDRWTEDGWTKLLRQDTQDASKELIVCVLENVHRTEDYFLGQLEATLNKWTQKNF
jgi:hypothetical protein